MKTHKNLYHQITDFGNLKLAAYQAQQGKRFNENVANFNMRLESELIQLKAELEEQNYQPGEYHTFYIFDPKKRMISAAPYRDRVVHHALCNIIEPIFERTFIFDSYANRKGKGTHKAIDRFQFFAKKYTYVLKCDVRKYFPSIDHQILKEQLQRKIGCGKTNQLINLIIDNSNPQEKVDMLFQDDNLFTNRSKGLPIGNLTSQYFANIFLNPLDHYIKEELKCKAYIRYVDDFVLFHQEKEALHEFLRCIQRFINDFRLKLHPNKCKVFPVRVGIPFLGFRIFPEHRLLKSTNLRNARKRIRRKIRLFKDRKLEEAKLEQSINSWLAHASHGNTFVVRQQIIQEIKKEVNLIRSPSCSWRVLEQQT